MSKSKNKRESMYTLRDFAELRGINLNTLKAKVTKFDKSNMNRRMDNLSTKKGGFGKRGITNCLT